MRRRRGAPAFGGAADSSAAVAWEGVSKSSHFWDGYRQPPSGSAAAARLPPGRSRACPRRCAGAALAGCLCPGLAASPAQHARGLAARRRGILAPLAGAPLRPPPPQKRRRSGRGGVVCASLCLAREARHIKRYAARAASPRAKARGVQGKAAPFAPGLAAARLPCRRARAAPHARQRQPRHAPQKKERPPRSCLVCVGLPGQARPGLAALSRLRPWVPSPRAAA